MSRGKRFIPSGGQDGIWFQHIGIPNVTDSRSAGTTAGIMMNDIFNKNARTLTTLRCPGKFREREKTVYAPENPFSEHDNRNSFQDHGVYFAQGLGKRKVSSDKSQQKSGDLLTWRTNGESDQLSSLNSLYREDFIGEHCVPPLPHRRFPKIYGEPRSGQIDLDTSSTTAWAGDEEDIKNTHLQTLADTQEPYLPPNPWKYSYHAHSFAMKQAKKQKPRKSVKAM